MSTHESTRPWLNRQPGESRDEWLIRQQRSCYFCDHAPFQNATQASDHEDVCPRNPHRRTHS